MVNKGENGLVLCTSMLFVTVVSLAFEVYLNK